MIRFEKNTELDTAMKNLILSMVDVDNYITKILEFNEGCLLRRRKKS
jgi:hypothetical protein